ncbi:MAG: EAL domain-containing protein, partial [Tenericutes bacterium]|nr:EAL domain-containing protein [Mycoplasmatota bacterium]
MSIIKFASAGAGAFELVAALLIIVLTAVALFFLYRNLVFEMREIRRKKKAVRDKDELIEDSGDDVSKLLSDVEEPEGKNILSFIEHAVKKTPEGKLGVLYYINIDNFEQVIVDIYDEKTIDKLIKEIEKKLVKFCAKNCLTGHLDEDTFLYYFKDTVDTENINSVGNELLELIREPLKSIEDDMTASVGAAVYPYDGINAKQLLKNAELATYVAKKEGKNSFKMFSEDLIQTEKFNIDYYQEIKQSIKNDEFILYYQAIIDIKTGRIIGLESLLRWDHPKMGILPPSRFINVMELTGDIVWFGSWGFEKTVAQFKEWTQKFRVRD